MTNPISTPPSTNLSASSGTWVDRTNFMGPLQGPTRTQNGRTEEFVAAVQNSPTGNQRGLAPQQGVTATDQSPSQAMDEFKQQMALVQEWQKLQRDTTFMKSVSDADHETKKNSTQFRV